MSFLSSLSRKLGFIGGEEDDREEELEEEELEEEEDEEEEEETSRFSFRFPFGGRNKVQSDDEESEEEYDAHEPVRREHHTPNSSRRGNVIHDSRMDARSAQEPRFTHCEHLVNVHQIEECREIIKCLLKNESVLLNLENIDPKDCGRVVDLLSGAAFALQGRMVKVAHLSYLLAPQCVHVVEEDVYSVNQRSRYNP